MAEPAPAPHDHSENRLQFEALIADLSSGFINLAPDRVDREIEAALRRACTFLGIELAVLWQWSGSDPVVIAPTHVFSQREDLRFTEPLRQELFPWFVQKMRAGRTVAVSSLEEMPAEAAVDRESCRAIGVKSNLTIPLAVGGEAPVGALGFNTLAAERAWPDAVVNRLRLVAEMFTNALARKRRENSLRESEERLSLAADSAGAGLWTLDYRTGTFWATERARAIFGYSPDDMISLEVLQASVDPDDWELVRGVIEQAQAAVDPVEVEYRIILPGDGGQRWILSRARPWYAPTGEPERLMGISIDITARKQADDALRVSQARLAAGADLAGLAFYEMDYGKGVGYVDDRFRALCGMPQDPQPGLQSLEFWLAHLHPDDLEQVRGIREQLHDGRLGLISTEYRYLHPDDGQKWFQHLARVNERDATGRATTTSGVIRDITASKQADEDLRDLSRRLIRAHEEERALLARELHDDLSQRLAVLSIDVGRAEMAAGDEIQKNAMTAVREGLVRLSEDVHTLAYQLHPSILEELGLIEALRTECERRGRQNRLEITTDLEPLPGVIAKDTALCLFRVAQEALGNVVRHAGALAASVTLRHLDDGLLLAVRDTGIGFDPGIPARGRHLGLAGMRERVRLVNGTLDIESAPGQGTTIVAWAPLAGEST